MTLSDVEHGQLNAMISKEKHPARKLLKARILLKADASDASDGWSDSQIATALEISVDTVARTRQHLVEEDVDGALTRHHSPNSVRRRIFDGEAEAKLIALTRSRPFARVLARPRAGTLDAGAARRAGRGAWHRRARQRQHNRSDAKKNIVKPHLIQQFVIPHPAFALGYAHK